MADFLPEDGTGLAGANSFASVEDADEFNNDQGNTAWAALDTATKERCLRRATLYINSRFRTRWYGQRLHPHPIPQALEWPRFGATDSQGYPLPLNAVPQQVKDATSLLAYKVSQGDIAPDLERGGLVASISSTEDKAGVKLSKSATMAAGAPVETVFPQLLEILGPIMTPYRLVRA